MTKVITIYPLDYYLASINLFSLMRYLPILFAFILFSCSAPLNNEKENIDGQQILIGSVNWDGLSSGEYGTWFIPNYKSYQVDATSLSQVESIINEIEITIFLGSWCEDSQVQVPQFYRMMDELGYDISSMNVVALERLENRDLVGPNGEEKGMNITHVPTFIFSKDGEELGRIVEYPNRTIEKDMVDIVLGQ